MNNPSEFGHPTLGPFGGPGGGGSGGGGVVPRQALAAQVAWFIDPINGRNNRSGTTLATAIQTRSEFFRRMAGVTLTQNVTVTITSSLLASDIQLSTIYIPAPFQLKFLGVPTVVASGTVSAVIINNGATNTTYKITITPTSGVIAGHAQQVIEKSDGTRRSVIIEDLAANQVHISPPITGVPYAQTDFIIGDTVNIYSLPSLGALQLNPTDGILSYRFLTATEWIENGQRTDLESCSGLALCYAGQLNVTSSFSANVTIGGSGTAFVDGGFVRLAPTAGAGIIINLTCVLIAGGGGIGLNCGGLVNCQSAAGNVPSLELFNCFISMASGGRLLMDRGYLYGTVGAGPKLIEMYDQNNVVALGQLPNVTNGTTVVLDLVGQSELISRLTSSVIYDYWGNLVSSKAGVTFDRQSLLRAERGLITESGGTRMDTGVSAVPSGTCFFQQVYLVAGDVISTSYIAIGTIPVALTLARIGIWDAVSGALLASCVDQSAAWATVGLKAQNFTVPLTVTKSGVYYVGLVVVAGTGPAICIGTALVGATRVGLTPGIGGRPLLFGSQTGVIDLPNPVTIAAGTAPGTWWFGLA